MPCVGTPALQHREPVHAWEAKVEDDGPVVLRVAEEPGIFTVCGGFHDIARGFERP